ncbi:hypothetical protein ScPMuIL_010336 [Solemya velum]
MGVNRLPNSIFFTRLQWSPRDEISTCKFTNKSVGLCLPAFGVWKCGLREVVISKLRNKTRSTTTLEGHCNGVKHVLKKGLHPSRKWKHWMRKH